MKSDSERTGEAAVAGAAPCSPVSCLEHRNGRDYLRFQPHGYEFPILLPVITHGSRDAANAWTWNGSTLKPTLKPSVKTTHADGNVSHIWLTDGMCQHLGDSTDGLAGQTLPLLHLANDPSSATRRTGGNDCNRNAPAGFAGAHG